MFSEQNDIKLEFNKNRLPRKSTNAWKINNILFKQLMVQKITKENQKSFLTDK